MNHTYRYEAWDYGGEVTITFQGVSGISVPIAVYHRGILVHGFETIINETGGGSSDILHVEVESTLLLTHSWSNVDETFRNFCGYIIALGASQTT